MSRYVHIELRATTLEAVELALRTLALPYTRPHRRVRLQGSLECTGDPVDIRLAAGILDTVEDFGFAVDDGVLRLICGELDEAQLQAELLPTIRQSITEQRIQQSVAQDGLAVVDSRTEPDGTRRLILELEDE